MKKNSFTLIELLIVISLIGITMGVTSDILISLIRGYNKSQILNEIEQQANFVSTKLQKELKNAKTVLNPSSVGSSSMWIQFQNADNEIVNYIVDENLLKRKIGSAVDIDEAKEGAVPVTFSDSLGGVLIECGDGCFTLQGSSPQIVKISLRFKQAGTSFFATSQGDVLIDDTVVIRSTY